MIGDIVFILVGVILVIFRDGLARGYVNFQNRSFGFKFGEKTVRFNTLLNVVGGVAFFTVGILGLLGIIPPVQGL